MKIISLTTCFLLLACFCHATGLRELQDIALKNRQVVDKFEANIQKSYQDVRLAKSSYYPSLDLSYTVNHLDDDTLYENQKNNTIYGAISVNLFAGFKDKYGIEAAELRRMADSYSKVGLEQDIQLSVALHYLAIFNSRALLKVSEDSHATLSKMYEDAKNRFEVGLINKNDLLKFKVDLNNSEFILKRAQVNARRDLKLLERQIGAPVAADTLDFSELEHLPALPDYELREADMLAKRSELKALGELIKASESQEKVEYGSRYPRVDLTNSYRSADESLLSDHSGVQDEEFRAQLVVSLNLFDGYGKQSKLSAARLSTQALKHDLAELKSDLQTELQILIMNFEINLENARVTKDSIEQAEENLRVDRLTYEEGVSTETELLNAISNLSRARFTFVAAKKEVFDNYYRTIRAVDGF